MDEVVITLKMKPNGSVDLALPVNVPFAVLAPLIVKALGWEERVDAEPITYAARVERDGLIVRPGESLAVAGVIDGDILELVHSKPQPRISTSNATRKSYSGPFLLGADGQTFYWRGKRALIGRGQPGLAVDVDLTALDAQHMTSRRHAQIWQDGHGEFWLRDLHSTNGTIVDGYALGPGQRVRLRHGCQIQFGHQGPVLQFRIQSI